MDTSYITQLNNALHRLESIKASQEKRLQELKQYDNVMLSSSRVKGAQYFYARDKGSLGRRYLGIESNIDVRCIKENKFIHQYLKCLTAEIDLIKGFLSNHNDLDYRAVNMLLPETYRSKSYRQNRDASHPAEVWRTEMQRIKDKYPIKHPEKLRFPAADGTLMRSKSEVIIANLLILNGIPYIYELPIVINGKLLYPDFTILSLIDLKTVIRIEHEGMMDKEFYQNSFLFKVNTFLSADMIPGRDVYFTFDDLHGVIDASPVQDIIDTRLKPRV